MASIQAEITKKLSSAAKEIAKDLKVAYKQDLDNKSKLVKDQEIRLASMKSRLELQDKQINKLNKYKFLFEDMCKVFSNNGYSLLNIDTSDDSVF